MNRPMFLPCILIPTYDNAATIRAVVESVRLHCTDVLVIDDGSGQQARLAVAQLEADGLARVKHLSRNGGKGAAVKAGFVLARELGFSHALQVDADGQHDIAAIPAFLAAARSHPDALVLARPVFAAGTPRGRRVAREFTNLWVAIETQGSVIRDAMIGFRVYPVERALAASARTDRMDFDIEIAVRMVWGGAHVLNLPLCVRYLTAEEGGVSHFRLWRDNVRITMLHTRLVVESLLRVPFSRARWGRQLLGPT